MKDVKGYVEWMAFGVLAIVLVVITWEQMAPWFRVGVVPILMVTLYSVVRGMMEARGDE